MHTVQADISQAETAQRIIEETLDRFGRIDTLINNAGIFIGKPFLEYKPFLRESDGTAMLVIFDLWSFDDVTANADSILAAVREGFTPCDAPWWNENVDLLQRWVNSEPVIKKEDVTHTPAIDPAGSHRR